MSDHLPVVGGGITGIVAALPAPPSLMSQPIPVNPPLELPPVVAFKQLSTHANGWSDHYGSMQVAAGYCGLMMPQRYTVGGIWQHGCIGPWYDFSPSLLCYHSPSAGSCPLYVARQDQADLLRKHGYGHARAIGLPILYTSEPKVERLAKSLLVVPTHTLVGDKFTDRTLFEQYANEVRTIAGQFSRVVVCVHPNCRKNGLWVKEFTDRGFEIVYGAETSDANALLRMRMLFSQFETLTTNGWGSHVAYGLTFGMRVSIDGTEPARSEADYLRDLTWAADKESLKNAMSGQTRQKEREFLKSLYVPAAAAVKDVTLGRWLTGWDNRVAPAEMRQILGTMIPHLLEHEAVIQARGQRQAARQEAARLVAARRPAEAVELFLRFVRSAAESKNAFLIYETLIEIAADLRTLDPQRAAKFTEQAQLLAVRIDAARRSAA